ncbi:xanthine dehydrogenase YagS FAD-binding subunit [Cnuella takakiae]|uniref:Xanthine dehydrogenase YagS FAD-binding subunit n=1 Tax=Cnuella takakiae TaxID=1302690 RepID=A0A1M5CMZ8_9BACT|nr:xanthine dehydrogenase family protein subunit M [Cnuella takakiae]OLY91875.1 FAD-binding molybdopterin dehydrogenase [Cnuella takakiae]SHF55782.1 xanthine dehydrogenase YagS FAD-binding subunit [Cnuella takakiae]
MINFDYIRVSTPTAAVDALAKDKAAQWIAGGTNLIDLMKKGVLNPQKLVDINNLPLKEIRKEGKVLRIGALALNSDVSEHELVLQSQPLLAQALKAGASQQIRNMATVGGNMMQRTRCPYFYNPDMPCNKREPGTGCGALKGFNRMHAIFGTSDKCIAVHPSDMCIALVALDATVLVAGPKGERRIPFQNFHRLPGELPQRDNTLERGELILGLEIPDNPFADHVHYLKVRDRSSYAFALVSVAAALALKGKTIQDVRLGMGGVAHKPWRLVEAESFLKGKQATEAVFREAANLAMRGAKGYGQNNFKLKLGPNTIVEALKKATEKA